MKRVDQRLLDRWIEEHFIRMYVDEKCKLLDIAKAANEELKFTRPIAASVITSIATEMGLKGPSDSAKLVEARSVIESLMEIVPVSKLTPALRERALNV